MIVEPDKIPTKDLHQFLLAAVAPRPIAFASTMSKDGVPNLAPYSFFNAFSSNPPILIFSSNRRVRDNTTKDTLKNVEETGEVVINVVSHSIVRQMALTSVEFESGVDEFEKAGLTPLPSDLVKPFRVAESPVNMECKVLQIIPLGAGGGAGNLIVCEIVRMHINDKILTEKGRIDPHKIDLMGRMGRFYYSRASGNAVSEIAQNVEKPIIGFDNLPARIVQSRHLTGNELAALAGLPELPDVAEISAFAAENAEIAAIMKGKNPFIAQQRLAKKLLKKGDASQALQVLMFN